MIVEKYSLNSFGCQRFDLVNWINLRRPLEFIASFILINISQLSLVRLLNSTKKIHIYKVTKLILDLKRELQLFLCYIYV